MALRDFSQKMQLPMPVWDIPTRAFHWLLVIFIAASYLTAKFDLMQIHLVSGYCILALLLFRITWGFVGSDTARFTSFVRSPIDAVRHLLHFARREPDTQVGHNAAGGWMVLGMLLILCVQVVTGLSANDDGATEGPLAKYVGKANSDWLSGIHDKTFTIIEILIALHILVIIAYAVVKRHNLVRPMLTGKKQLPAATPAPRMVSPVLALVILVVEALGVVAIATKL